MKKLGYAAAVLVIGIASSQAAWAQEETTPTAEPEATAPAPSAPEVATPPAEPEAVEPKAEEAKPEEVKAEEPKAEEPKPEEVKADEAAVETAPAEAAPPAEEVKATAPAEAAPAEAASAEVAPAEAAPAVETIDASDGDTGFTEVGDSSIDPSLSAEVETEEEEEETKPFGVFVAVSHGIGSGTFITSDCPGSGFEPIDDLEAELAAGHRCIGNRTQNVVQTWDIRPRVNFELFGHKLSAMARWVMDYEFTTPDSNPPRQFVPYDLSLYLIDPEIYKEPFTDIAFNGTLRVFLPTSFESINVTNMIFGATLYAGASRSVGPVDLGYTFSVRKNFNTQPVAEMVGATRSSDNGRPIGNAIAIPKGFPNLDWRISNSFEVIWHPIEELSVGYSLLIYHNIRYNTVPTDDEFTAEFAQSGAQNSSDMMWPTFEVGYNLKQGLSDVVDLPIDVGVALGVTALHPAQELNNKGFIAPVVFNMFTSDKAPNNYASVYFDLTAAY